MKRDIQEIVTKLIEVVPSKHQVHAELVWFQSMVAVTDRGPEEKWRLVAETMELELHKAQLSGETWFEPAFEIWMGMPFEGSPAQQEILREREEELRKRNRVWARLWRWLWRRE